MTALAYYQSKLSQARQRAATASQGTERAIGEALALYYGFCLAQQEPEATRRVQVGEVIEPSDLKDAPA